MGKQVKPDDEQVQAIQPEDQLPIPIETTTEKQEVRLFRRFNTRDLQFNDSSSSGVSSSGRSIKRLIDSYFEKLK